MLGDEETLEESIRRHLETKVDVRRLSHLEQLETLSEPVRHPEQRLIATVSAMSPKGVEVPWALM